MENLFDFGDELGPTKIIHVHEPACGLKAILVVDNVAAGPAIGGVRMAEDVSLEECVRLARAMTLKNAMAGLAHGGAKSVLFGDPKMPLPAKEQRIRAFASALRDTHEYIFGPDMGTNERCMAWVKDETGRSAGLPHELGGIPLDELGITGWGVYHASRVAAEFCDLDLGQVRFAVQGFGAVGKHAARFLGEQGAVLIAASDSRGTLHDPEGLDIEALIELKASGASLCDHDSGIKQERDAIVDVECELWIPAARPDVLRADNISRLNARMVVQGANIPASAEAEEAMHRRKILSVPDFVANAGGVISAAMEYHGATESAVFPVVEEKLTRNTRQVLEAAFQDDIEPRKAALEIAEARVRGAMSLRRWSTFSSAPRFV